MLFVRIPCKSDKAKKIIERDRKYQLHHPFIIGTDHRLGICHKGQIRHHSSSIVAACGHTCPNTAYKTHLHDPAGWFSLGSAGALDLAMEGEPLDFHIPHLRTSTVTCEKVLRHRVLIDSGMQSYASTYAGF